MPADPPVYESIGRGYARSRRADPRWAARIRAEFAGARTLVNVGAGSGSYEPDSLEVVAVEPSQTMIRQRPTSAAPVVCAYAEQLPFPDGKFDVALAVLTTHHWKDARVGLSEMRRVALSQVVVTWDPDVFARAFWLVRDYLPELVEHEKQLATLGTVEETLKRVSVSVLPVPADCLDGVLGAYWRRPAAYLDGSTRAAMSGIALTDPATVARAMERLQRDLSDGTWKTRNAEILEVGELDLGYRLVSAG